MRVGVLASGAGTNLQAILDHVHGRAGVEVVAVGSDKPDAQALQRAQAAGVETAVFAADEFGGDRVARDGAMAAWLVEQGVGLVVLAGYMQLLDPHFLGRFPQRRSSQRAISQSGGSAPEPPGRVRPVEGLIAPMVVLGTT